MIPQAQRSSRWRPWTALLACSRTVSLSAVCCTASACIEIAPPAFREDSESIVPSCQRNDECPGGSCDPELNLCVARMRNFPGLLLDIVPETVDQGFGGFHIQQKLEVLATNSRKPQSLQLQQPPEVKGRIGPELCEEIAPLRITFVPRQTHLGLALGRYTTVSKREFEDSLLMPQHNYRFGGIPLGNYDVYWQDAGKVQLTDPACEVVPQIFRNIPITKATDLPLNQLNEGKHQLQVLIPYTDQLEGWSVDVVHSVTGEAMSTRRVIDAAAVRDVEGSETQAQEFALELQVADVIGADYVPANGAQLLRLTPPLGTLRPTIYFSLLGLVVVDRDVAQLAPFARFGSPANFRAWVWQDDESHAPVVGDVELEALELVDTQGQGRLELSVTVPIASDGLIETQLPPGEYRARVKPKQPGAVVFDTTVRIAASETIEGSQVQAGRVISVPAGSKLNGRVRIPYPLASFEGTLIRAQGLAGSSGALTFRPRSETAIVGDDGRYSMTNLDCGTCDDSAEVNFTLVAEPPAELGLPWSVKSRVRVQGEATVDFDFSFPAVHFGKLLFQKRNGTVGALPGALIRALALVDAEGKVLPVDTPGCFEQPPIDAQAGAPCARGTVEVARGRSGNDGQFRLMLPTDLAEFGE